MPTYEYRCGDCGFEFEKFQSMTARALRKCPQCGKRTLRRLIGAGAGVIFKGSGFYATDYRSEAYKIAVTKETGTDSKKSEKKETKAQTKNASKEGEKSNKPKTEKKPA